MTTPHLVTRLCAAVARANVEGTISDRECDAALLLLMAVALVVDLVALPWRWWRLRR